MSSATKLNSDWRHTLISADILCTFSEFGFMTPTLAFTHYQCRTPQVVFLFIIRAELQKEIRVGG